MEPDHRSAPAATVPGVGRLASLDIARGVVMVLMAIDHVRVYAGLPPGGPTPGIFFTRWVTHFAAPAFCFLAGTGAFLNGQKLGGTRALSRYLLERGALLVVLELTLLRESWTFNLDYAHYIQGNVIWMLGWCMILMAWLVRYPARRLAAFGLTVIFAQDLITIGLGMLPEPTRNATAWLWQLLYLGGKIDLGTSGLSFVAIYSIVPWIGVMAAGYGFGELMQQDAETRRKWTLRIGLAATAAFVVGAGAPVLLTPAGPDDPAALFRFLGQRKYPASQLYLLMTLGPTIAFLSVAERMRGTAARVLETFGRVPMFYYLLHIPLIHLLAVLVSWLRYGSVTPWLFGNHPWAAGAPPEGYPWSFVLLYLVFANAVLILYFACRWYVGIRARHKASWLRYI